MNSQTKDTIIDYIASLSEYAADHSIEINNIYNSLIEKIHYLEVDVFLNKLQKLEQEVQQQGSVLEKSIEHVDNHAHTKLNSVEEKIINKVANQVKELKDMRSQLYTQIERVERKTSSLNTEYHQELVRKIDVNHEAP